MNYLKDSVDEFKKELGQNEDFKALLQEKFPQITDKDFQRDVAEFVGSFPEVVANLDSTQLCDIAEEFFKPDE